MHKFLNRERVALKFKDVSRRVSLNTEINYNISILIGYKIRSVRYNFSN